MRATGLAIMRGLCRSIAFGSVKGFEIFRADADALLADGGGLIFDLTTVCSRLRGKASAG